MITATIGSTLYHIHADGTQKKRKIPMKTSYKERFLKARSTYKKRIIKAWKRVYHQVPEEVVIYEISPTSAVRNNQAYVLAKVIAGFYRKPQDLRSWFTGGTLCVKKKPYRVNFRVVMKQDDVRFYFILPKEKAGEIVRKAEAVYDSGITLKEITAAELPKLDPTQTFCTELNYRKHDIFSLATDRDNNYPLPSMLAAVRTLEDDDVAVFDALLEPGNLNDWLKEAKQAHALLEQGHMPTNSAANKLFRLLNKGFHKLRYELVSVTRITKDQQQAFKTQLEAEKAYSEASRVRAEMTNPTKRKQGDEVLKAWLRIAVQSKVPGRAKDAAYTVANSWKDLSADNELERTDIPKKWTAAYLDAIETRKGFSIKFKPNIVSVNEAGKFIQLPGRELIKEFPQIAAQKVQEVSLPDELTQEDIKTVRIGSVTERGVKKQARIPLEAFGGMKRKAVYDALCTSTFGQGKQGSGKSEGFGTVWAYDMLMAGFTAIVTDTADGQVLRNLVNSLPADFPEEKIHALNMDNKAYPIPLGWDDVYGRNFAGADGDEELQALEITERLTSRFVGFINSLTKTGEFTDRMAQYVISCMRAITVQPGWSFLDLELALTSPSYRKELLLLEGVKAQPEVVRDLQTLQDKAEKGSLDSFIDPILSRLKILSSTQFMANLFYQAPKLDENGKPILDLRKLMDNEEGGYGHLVVIQASGLWEENQATILGFFEDKINFNAFSRIDQDQDERKPVLKWIDEPHKVVKAIEGKLSGTAVEFRKYRVKNLFTGHSIDQMGEAAAALMDGGAQITSYKTERLSELRRFAHSFAPYKDATELYEALPDKHRAINKVRLPSGKDCPAFIADMQAPPAAVKDRSHVWHDCAKKYGRPWKEVRDAIQDKRSKYQELDIQFYTAVEEAKLIAKQLEAAAKAAARKAAK